MVLAGALSLGMIFVYITFWLAVIGVISLIAFILLKILAKPIFIILSVILGLLFLPFIIFTVAGFIISTIIPLFIAGVIAAAVVYLVNSAKNNKNNNNATN